MLLGAYLELENFGIMKKVNLVIKLMKWQFTYTLVPCILSLSAFPWPPQLIAKHACYIVQKGCLLLCVCAGCQLLAPWPVGGPCCSVPTLTTVPTNQSAGRCPKNVFTQLNIRGGALGDKLSNLKNMTLVSGNSGQETYCASAKQPAVQKEKNQQPKSKLRPGSLVLNKKD